MLESVNAKRPCIKLQTSNAHLIELFLRFVYTGHLRELDTNCLEMFRLGEQLCVEHLKVGFFWRINF
jgi:hypothetical protein